MDTRTPGNARRQAPAARPSPRAFTLVELLVVMAIIGLLIAILVPAVSVARRSARNAQTATLVKSVGMGLELFKQDNGADFRATNGYPPSFSHPPIPGFAFDPHEGKYPFAEAGGALPTAYGAHWLPMMLVGADLRGYVKRSAVPKPILDEPDKWYENEPQGPDSEPIPRSPAYIDLNATRLLKTGELPGELNSASASAFYPDGGLESVNDLVVIVDPFDQPLLYYAANAFGRPTNMVEPVRNADGDYLDGPPFYFHQDNAGFTGDLSNIGWDFGSGVERNPSVPADRLHKIARSGADLTAQNIEDPGNDRTFAHYIVDHGALARKPDGVEVWPMMPVRPDSYLLITAGADGHYGTTDDINNLPETDH